MSATIPFLLVDLMPDPAGLGRRQGQRQPSLRRHMWRPSPGEKPSPHEDILINVEAFRGRPQRQLETFQMATCLARPTL